MKIVMTYIIGDNVSWSAENTICFEYDSIEAAYSDFVDAHKKQLEELKTYYKTIEKLTIDKKFKIKRPSSDFNIFGYSFYVDDFNEIYPEFKELNYWFESKSKN